MKSHSPPAPQGAYRDPARERSWRGLLRQFAAGGQSVRAFCADRRLPETAFYFWRREIQRRDGQAPPRRQHAKPRLRRPAAFTRILLQPPQAAEEGLRLRLSNGRELLLPASWPLRRVAKLLRAIEGQTAIEETA